MCSRHPGNHIQMVWPFVRTGPSMICVCYVTTAEGRVYFTRGRLKSEMTPQNHQRSERKLHSSHSSAEEAPTNMAPISIKTVLISESVDPRCRSILEENGIRVTEKQNMKKDELIAEIKVRCGPSQRVPAAERYTTSPKLHQRSGDVLVSVRRLFQTAATASALMHRFDQRTVHVISRSLLRFSTA